MIIFDLDGTLADCEHRRHFVDSSKLPNRQDYDNWMQPFIESKTCPEWKPDWQAFYEACDKDKPIQPSIDIIKELRGYDYYDSYKDVDIWSGRCESVKEKTEKWLCDHNIAYRNLKMRPIGNTQPDDELKEMWLDEYIDECVKDANKMRFYSGQKIMKREDHDINFQKHGNIDFVFDDRPKVIRMWRRRGIFVFNCCQHDEEF